MYQISYQYSVIPPPQVVARSRQNFQFWRTAFSYQEIIESLQMVGKPGFEPGTPCSQSKCASQLRYSPIEYLCKSGLV